MIDESEITEFLQPSEIPKDTSEVYVDSFLFKTSGEQIRALYKTRVFTPSNFPYQLGNDADLRIYFSGNQIFARAEGAIRFYQDMDGFNSFFQLYLRYFTVQNVLYLQTSPSGYPGKMRADDFVLYSSIRGKDNIEDIPNPDTKLREMTPKSFTINNKPQAGFILESSPEWAKDRDDEGVEALSTSTLIAVLWKAVQDLQARVELLEKG